MFDTLALADVLTLEEKAVVCDELLSADDEGADVVEPDTDGLSLLEAANDAVCVSDTEGDADELADEMLNDAAAVSLGLALTLKDAVFEGEDEGECVAEGLLLEHAEALALLDA